MPFPDVERGAFPKPHCLIYIKLRNDTMAISTSPTAKILAMLVHKMQITWCKNSVTNTCYRYTATAVIKPYLRAVALYI